MDLKHTMARRRAARDQQSPSCMLHSALRSVGDIGALLLHVGTTLHTLSSSLREDEFGGTPRRTDRPTRHHPRQEMLLRARGSESRGHVLGDAPRHRGGVQGLSRSDDTSDEERSVGAAPNSKHRHKSSNTQRGPSLSDDEAPYVASSARTELRAELRAESSAKPGAGRSERDTCIHRERRHSHNPTVGRDPPFCERKSHCKHNTHRESLQPLPFHQLERPGRAVSAVDVDGVRTNSPVCHEMDQVTAHMGNGSSITVQQREPACYQTGAVQSLQQWRQHYSHSKSESMQCLRLLAGSESHQFKLLPNAQHHFSGTTSDMPLDVSTTMSLLGPPAYLSDGGEGTRPTNSGPASLTPPRSGGSEEPQTERSGLPLLMLHTSSGESSMQQMGTDLSMRTGLQTVHETNMRRVGAIKLLKRPLKMRQRSVLSACTNEERHAALEVIVETGMQAHVASGQDNDVTSDGELKRLKSVGLSKKRTMTQVGKRQHKAKRLVMGQLSSSSDSGSCGESFDEEALHGPDVHKVERILDMRSVSLNEREFLIKWQGWSAKWNGAPSSLPLHAFAFLLLHSAHSILHIALITCKHACRLGART